MKKNWIIGCISTLLFASSIAHADFNLYASAGNACDYIAGHWAGKGTASSWLIGDCIYHGAGSISAPDVLGRFSIELSADKESGNIVCPNHAKKQLRGICSNGKVTITTEYGNINGNFSKNSGSAQGTLTVAPGVSADVVVQFQRVG
ncbi:hypothetical protein EAS68_13080 [Legionella jordanis]|uniref:hypothetical protein n=1 Tax=Legionella jordanis TaxID=456 RepID=UPI000EFF3E39|nr:hypothetical protein [Legionella jordanis]RMX15115.1 hypothetical protein EAS68_13080 [Legionella jordanis]